MGFQIRIHEIKYKPITIIMRYNILRIPLEINVLEWKFTIYFYKQISIVYISKYIHIYKDLNIEIMN
jgi:hypothetical protein